MITDTLEWEILYNYKIRYLIIEAKRFLDFENPELQNPTVYQKPKS